MIAVVGPDGRLEQVVATLDGIDLTGRTTAAAPAAWAQMAWDAAARRFVASAARVEAPLIAAINAERERRQSAMLTGGAGKALAYQCKAAEVRAWDALLPAAIAALTAAQLRERFPAATRDAAAHGDRALDAIARFRAGMLASQAEVLRIDAIAVAAIARVRAAPIAGKPAAAIVDWSAPL